MLDDTLVVLMSEHGRTPRIQTNISGGGRDHWSRAYSTLLVGGGVKRGQVIGGTDSIASDVTDRRSRPSHCWPRCITCWESIRTRQFSGRMEQNTHCCQKMRK